jgi:hypothetical protein
MIVEILLIISFAIFFNWSVNMQILAVSEKGKKDKTVAIIISFILAILLGIIVSIT